MWATEKLSPRNNGNVKPFNAILPILCKSIKGRLSNHRGVSTLAQTCHPQLCKLGQPDGQYYLLHNSGPTCLSCFQVQPSVWLLIKSWLASRTGRVGSARGDMGTWGREEVGGGGGELGVWTHLLPHPYPVLPIRIRLWTAELAIDTKQTRQCMRSRSQIFGI